MKHHQLVIFGFVAALAVSLSGAKAEGVAMVEDFESYTTGVGDWGISGSTNINATLALGLTGAIDGDRDLVESLNATLLSSSYTIGNSNLNVEVPGVATHFKFKIRPLVALNLSRSVAVILTGLDGQSVSRTYTSPARNLALLNLGSTTDLHSI